MPHAMLSEDGATVLSVFGGPQDPEAYPNQEELADDDERLAAFYSRMDPSAAGSVPSSITMRQARLALLGAGLLGTVQAALEALPEGPREAALIEWEYAATVDRDSPLLQQVVDAGGLDLDLDELFTVGSTL